MTPAALPFVLLFFVLCVMAFTRHPVYGLVAYVAEFYVHPPVRWWGQGLLADIRWSLIAAAVTILALLFRRQQSSAMRLGSSGAFWGFIAMVVWVVIQSLWALDAESHAQQVNYYVKFVLVLFMVCKCLETEKEVKIFLWAHVLGCFYLGTIAFSSYEGGRFEDFGSSNIQDANAAALILVTGTLVGGALFLHSGKWLKPVLFLTIPFIVNALIATVSRGGFLSLVAGGLLYNLFVPKTHRLRVRVLSVLGVLLFFILTTDNYWSRMDTIKETGADIAGVDTGGGRLEIMAAQWRMSRDRPFGCGHMCTTYLSPQYIEQRFLSAGRDRASHNTFMTMVVDHGIPGVLLYLACAIWVARSGAIMVRRLKGQNDFLAVIVPGVTAAQLAIFAGDMFAQYPTFEARIWFLGLSMVLLHLTAQRQAGLPVIPSKTAAGGDALLLSHN